MVWVRGRIGSGIFALDDQFNPIVVREAWSMRAKRPRWLGSWTPWTQLNILGPRPLDELRQSDREPPESMDTVLFRLYYSENPEWMTKMTRSMWRRVDRNRSGPTMKDKGEESRIGG